MRKQSKPLADIFQVAIIAATLIVVILCVLSGMFGWKHSTFDVEVLHVLRTRFESWR